MKALVLTGPGGLERLAIQDVPTPVVAKPDDVLVRVHTAGLNRLDLFVLTGLPGVTHHYPHVMVGDGAGVVEAVGTDVEDVGVGDRVMINPGVSCHHCEYCEAGEHSLCLTYQLLGEHCPGTAAEYIVLPVHNLAVIPDTMPWDRAGAFSLANLTAWRMLTTRAKLRAGETVLIWGIGGGVAQAALQIAKLVGATTIVTSSSDAKLERAAEMGADFGLNHNDLEVRKEVRRLTAGRGVDVVVDNVGESTWMQSLRSLRPEGRLVTCGATSGPIVSMDIRKLFWYQWEIYGSTMGSHAEYQAIARLAGQGKLWPVIDSVVPLAQSRQAFERLERGAQFGKIVIEIPR